MLIKARRFLSFVLLLNCVMPIAVAYNTNNLQVVQMVWQQQPLRIYLPVGKSRVLMFSQSVQLGYNPTLLPTTLLQVTMADHSVVLLAKKPFHTKPVEVRLKNGTTLLILLSAVSHATDNPIQVKLAPNKQGSHHGPQTPLTPVTLTRAVLQQLYAPKPVLASSTLQTKLHRVPMGTTYVVPLVFAKQAIALPLASWQAQGVYVTAVELRNNLPYPLTLRPQQFCGHWRTVSFYPRKILSAHGAMNMRTSTTAVLVSTMPFAQAIAPCLATSS